MKSNIYAVLVSLQDYLISKKIKGYKLIIYTPLYYLSYYSTFNFSAID